VLGERHCLAYYGTPLKVISNENLTNHTAIADNTNEIQSSSVE